MYYEEDETSGWIGGYPYNDMPSFNRFPFSIVIKKADSTYINHIYTNASETSHILKISATTTFIKKIDEKFIPTPPVSSVNGQEGDVYLSYEDLENQPFGIVEYWENYLLENEVINSDVVELDTETLKENFRYDIAIEDTNGNRGYISDFANHRIYSGHIDPITGESIYSLIEVGGDDGLIMPDRGFYLISYRL
jgi:hypothetical protein